MKKVRLLVIDEHQAVRTALETRLRSSNAIELVVSAHDVTSGQSCMRPGSPDVVLYGLKSSNSTGLEPTLKAVARLSGKGIPVIVLASYADDIQREMFLLAGARRYLLKDINSSQLIDAIVAVSSEATA
jgi:two-component system response regulator DevR